ncbi:Uncharacterized protein ESCO_002080 [Escovopsis weberi]|uniref:Endonuclease/exonuclease/phosphatase domain-containing protein n=1 Tax=Escovopsis weberi TaxID=150374 RepID=A0A0M8N3L1_ESCWE|nr:Uncharacterized protein ESCO_002080 [Escovopsis weberi]
MRLSSLPFFALAAGLTLFGGPVPASAAAVTARDSKPSGSLTLLEKEKLLTFRYSTKSQDDRNWIGIYWSFYGGPDNEKYVDDSLAWAYAPGESGEVRVDVSGFQPGNYKAYLLAQDGYKWLAKPIDVLLPGSGPVEFITPSITTHNARQGDRFTAQLGGLIANPRDNETKFYRAETDDDWVSVAQDGEISGKPGKRASDTKLVVQAVASDGTKAYITVTIPVRPAKSALVEELRVMSYNMWYGGSKVDGYHAKQVRFLVESNVDIVGTQESWNGQTIRLAKALGWYYWQSHENGILSRYPIKETFPEQQAGGSVRIALDGDRTQLIMWNVHLGYNPYGPYDFCFDRMPLEQVLDREVESGRTPQIVEVVKAMRGKLRDADKVPVLLTGDFNAPSHLDWTEDNGADHCDAGYVPWPSSVYPINAGLIDSYRQRHPDPKKDPGTTWSPIYLDNDGRAEPMDRIDFVYHKGSRLQVLDSEAVMMGEPKAEPNHAQNEWTSDHKAVLTLYKVLPPSNKRWDL